jgi:GT2 family glycosyltransferase
VLGGASVVHTEVADVGSSVKPKERTAIIIVGRNEAKWIRACLKSVLNEVPFWAVFYVDNASSDGTASIVRNHFPGITIIRNADNLGFAAANNLVLRHLLESRTFEYFVLLNPDTLLLSGVLQKLEHFLACHQLYAAVGPLQMEYDGINFTEQLNRVSRRDVAIGQYHILKRWLPEVTLQVRSANIPELLDVYYVQGSAFLVRAAALREIGLFDELFHSFYEEVDLCRRALWAGHKLGLLTNVLTPHASRGPGDRSRWRRYLRFRNKYLFTLTDPNIAVRWIPIVLFRLLISDLREAFFSTKQADMSLTSSTMAIAWLVGNIGKVVRARACRQRLVRSGRPGCLIGRYLRGQMHIF